MEPLKIGFIGAGTNTKERHIPGFQAIDGVELEMVCNRSEESSKAVAEAFGIKRIGMTWREVVEDPEVDAICIGTWPYLHADASIAALKNGKHVLCEARMAMNLEEAETMLKASKAAPHLVAQVVPSPFTLEWDETVKRMMADGTLGPLREVRAVHTGGQAVREDTPLTWRQHFEYSGINVLSMGIFHEAIQRWLPEEPAWISADGAIFHEYRLDPETERPHHVRIPETLTVTGRYPDQSRLIYHFSSLESGNPEMGIWINAENGSLQMDLQAGELRWAEAGQTEEKELEIPEAEKKGWNVEADFVASIREGKPVERTSFVDGVRYMAFTQRVFESLAQEGARK